MSKHDYNTCILEGLFSRGDERVGKVILSAYKKGARLDAWEEHLEENMTYWNEAFTESGWDVLGYVYKKWNMSDTLPWSGVTLGPSQNFYKREWQKSIEHELTPKCESNCQHPCGVCNTKNKVSVHSPQQIESVSDSIKNNTVLTPCTYPESNIRVLYRVIFSFARTEGSEFISYLSQVEIFHKAFLRSSLPIVFSNGFNPLPRIEFATAMSLGIPSNEEIASCMLYTPIDENEFIAKMNSALPNNLSLLKAFIFPVTNQRKRESLCESLWGASYKYTFCNRNDMETFISAKGNEVDLYPTNNSKPRETKSIEYSMGTENTMIISVPSEKDKRLRVFLENCFNKKWYQIAGIEKINTLAKPMITGWTDSDEMAWRTNGKCENNDDKMNETMISDGPISYFDLYHHIAKVNATLISQREQFDIEKDAFYKNHPEVLEKRQKKQN